jgi:hypothetical protein
MSRTGSRLFIEATIAVVEERHTRKQQKKWNPDFVVFSECKRGSEDRKVSGFLSRVEICSDKKGGSFVATAYTRIGDEPHQRREL